MDTCKETLEVKEKILQTARVLFVEKGYDATSVRDIAAASGTNLAMVNYYFHSKFNLFEIIFEESLDILVDKIFTILSSSLPFFELIETWIETYYDILLENPHIPIFLLREINQNPERLTRRIASRRPQDIFFKISKRIDEEVERGTIAETSSVDLLLNVLSLCIFPFMFRSLAMSVSEKSSVEYTEMLQQHKRYVIDFVKNALKK